MNEFKRGGYEASLYYLFKSMECLMKTSIDRDKLPEIILNIKNIIKGSTDINISEDEIVNYMKIIASTEDKGSGDIIVFLNSIRK
jgi:hypothetical protein